MDAKDANERDVEIESREHTEEINGKNAPWDLRIRRILFPVTKRT